jgi:hypothetical protein
MEEGFGFDQVHGSVLGFLEVWSELFLKDHWLGNKVLVSTARDGLVHVNSGPSSSTSQLEQESIVSLEASLKSEESSQTSVHFFPSGSSSRAAELGGRLRLSRPMAALKTILEVL